MDVFSLAEAIHCLLPSSCRILTLEQTWMPLNVGNLRRILAFTRPKRLRLSPTTGLPEAHWPACLIACLSAPFVSRQKSILSNLFSLELDGYGLTVFQLRQILAPDAIVIKLPALVHCSALIYPESDAQVSRLPRTDSGASLISPIASRLTSLKLELVGLSAELGLPGFLFELSSVCSLTSLSYLLKTNSQLPSFSFNQIYSYDAFLATLSTLFISIDTSFFKLLHSTLLYKRPVLLDKLVLSADTFRSQMHEYISQPNTYFCLFSVPLSPVPIFFHEIGILESTSHGLLTCQDAFREDSLTNANQLILHLAPCSIPHIEKASVLDAMGHSNDCEENKSSVLWLAKSGYLRNITCLKVECPMPENASLNQGSAACNKFVDYLHEHFSFYIFVLRPLFDFGFYVYLTQLSLPVTLLIALASLPVGQRHLLFPTSDSDCSLPSGRHFSNLIYLAVTSHPSSELRYSTSHFVPPAFLSSSPSDSLDLDNCLLEICRICPKLEELVVSPLPNFKL
ncbi:unnamed protein product [Protopolystoma xenopodis]|uniref:Uncharacterized protein n=1 Tax=Protopolystoma xenopodis TaxID=117903 RepID=A0A3S5C4L0_9PLAT|nr:unnamed protein product [Protopolystoma xenopodis]